MEHALPQPEIPSLTPDYLYHRRIATGVPLSGTELVFYNNLLFGGDSETVYDTGEPAPDKGVTRATGAHLLTGADVRICGDDLACRSSGLPSRGAWLGGAYGARITHYQPTPESVEA